MRNLADVGAFIKHNVSAFGSIRRYDYSAANFDCDVSSGADWPLVALI